MQNTGPSPPTATCCSPYKLRQKHKSLFPTQEEASFCPFLHIFPKDDYLTAKLFPACTRPKYARKALNPTSIPPYLTYYRHLRTPLLCKTAQVRVRRGKRGFSPKECTQTYMTQEKRKPYQSMTKQISRYSTFAHLTLCKTAQMRAVRGNLCVCSLFSSARTKKRLKCK